MMWTSTVFRLILLTSEDTETELIQCSSFLPVSLGPPGPLAVRAQFRWGWGELMKANEIVHTEKESEKQQESWPCKHTAGSPLRLHAKKRASLRCVRQSAQRSSTSSGLFFHPAWINHHPGPERASADFKWLDSECCLTGAITFQPTPIPIPPGHRTHLLSYSGLAHSF